MATWDGHQVRPGRRPRPLTGCGTSQGRPCPRPRVLRARETSLSAYFLGAGVLQTRDILISCPFYVVEATQSCTDSGLHAQDVVFPHYVLVILHWSQTHNEKELYQWLLLFGAWLCHRELGYCGLRASFRGCWLRIVHHASIKLPAWQRARCVAYE